MGFQFKKATKEQARLRLAVHGPSGAGKTFTGLSVATAIVEPGQRVAVLDTERGSASKYADKFDFDVVEVSGDYHPGKCIEFLAEAAKAGYGAVLIDSGTHFWNGIGGFLALVDAEAKKMASRSSGRPDSFGAWKNIDPIYQHLVQAITSSPLHVIMTLRAKQAYEKVENENGRGTKVQKMGLAPQMRDDFQYEFDIEGMLNLDHDLVIGKTRCDALDGKVFSKPGKDFAAIVKAWLADGATPTAKPAVSAPSSVERAATIAKVALDEIATEIVDRLSGVEPSTGYLAHQEPETGPTPMFIAIGAQIEQSNDENEIDALMAEAREAFKGKLMTVDQGKQLGAIANRRKAALRGEVAA